MSAGSVGGVAFLEVSTHRWQSRRTVWIGVFLNRDGLRDVREVGTPAPLRQWTVYLDGTVEEW